MLRGLPVRCLSLLTILTTAGLVLAQPQDQPFDVNIVVDASRPIGPLRRIWRFFGADEPNYGYMKYGRRLLAALGQLASHQVFFRAHNLLTSGDGTPALKWGSTNAYREDEKGNPIYDWTILDRIFDTYMDLGIRPYVEIGFMPRDLSIRPEPYQHSWTPAARYDQIYTGWAYPPKDYNRWAELVYQWVQHCISRYGSQEVENWYWQVWNEANIGYWQGTVDEFLKLHDYAIDAVRRALPRAKVGGPDCAGSGGNFMRRFLEHCLDGTSYATGTKGTPLDFVSFHAKGAPTYVEGHVRMGISAQLRTIEDGFKIITSYPQLKGIPVVIGECDPEGCAACQGPQLAYRNGTMYPCYTAASFARIHDLADLYGVNLDGALTWAFEFEDQPYFAGFRSLATNGIEKPVFNIFRMFSMMSGQRLAVESDHQVPLEVVLKDGIRNSPDVSALASIGDSRMWILVWHYHDDDLPGPSAQVKVEVKGLPIKHAQGHLEHYRIDQQHSNPYAAWVRMGRPQAPTEEQYDQLIQASRLALLAPPCNIGIAEGRASIGFEFPRQAVSLLVLNW
ncbi:MAG: hypothetical protein QHH07_04685 [Sedimentisphaerales bacterium]|nr:hypothetical protein [Sedimentisphaerales bacterium]